jgi:hypothetical protein
MKTNEEYKAFAEAIVEGLLIGLFISLGVQVLCLLCLFVFF